MMLRGRSPVLFLPPGPCLGEGRKKAKAGERGLEDAGKADKRLKEDNVGRESDRGDSMEVGQLEGKKTGKLCRNLGNREGSEKKKPAHYNGVDLESYSWIHTVQEASGSVAVPPGIKSRSFVNVYQHGIPYMFGICEAMHLMIPRHNRGWEGGLNSFVPTESYGIVGFFCERRSWNRHPESRARESKLTDLDPETRLHVKNMMDNGYSGRQSMEGGTKTAF
ncbi:hypothetical protein H6P81_015548 [Aristolochia fimbriata]|uniref:Uncharacterized protein n=1 Tax=Aristolochia fimbriata TaxID=158543 RepID=A0AAV7E6C9_ARIFI|nr:hypothetical protein H6P81_015548 [Aristolochia fimbriata]